jgi:hypothetical protein
MAGKLSTFPSGVQSHELTRGISRISTNSRARTTRGFIGLVTEVVLFPGPNGTGAIGTWFMPNQRVRVNNIPTIGRNSVGISVSTEDGTTGTMIVVEGEGRGDAM